MTPISHHPDDDLLVPYATGVLDEARSLAVATHASLCPACRRRIAEAEAVGGVLIDDLSPAPLAADALAATLARIDRAPAPRRAAPVQQAAPVLPEPLRTYLGTDLAGVSWRRLGRGAFHRPIATGGAARARLLMIPAGRPVPRHGHRGQELTLVLAGGFTDEAGHFLRGDMECADDAVEHQPVADPGEPCVCLAVTEAPLRFRSLLARLAQPFLGI